MYEFILAEALCSHRDQQKILSFTRVYRVANFFKVQFRGNFICALFLCFHKFTRSPLEALARLRQVNGVSSEFMCGSIFEIMMLKFHHQMVFFFQRLDGRYLAPVDLNMPTHRQRAPVILNAPPRYLNHHSPSNITL